MIALPTLAGLKAIGALAWGRATGSQTTRIATICLVGLAAYGAWLKFVHDPRVAAREKAKIERRTDAQVKKSVEAQRSVPVAGAALRLRTKYCADC